MSRLFRGVLCLLSAVLLVGCGGRGEKGKNQDQDRPKPAASPSTPR